MTYSLKECEGGVLEETVKVAFSELVVSLTVEAMFSFLRPLSQITRGQVSLGNQLGVEVYLCTVNRIKKYCGDGSFFCGPARLTV